MKKSSDLRIDLNKKDSEDITAFQSACINGHKKMAEMLIEKSYEFGIDLNAKTKAYGTTAFHLACKFGHMDTAKILMEKSSTYNNNLNAKDKIRWTALHYACNFSSTNIVEMLIDNEKFYEFYLTSKDFQGKTGFRPATTKVVEILSPNIPFFLRELNIT